MKKIINILNKYKKYIIIFVIIIVSLISIFIQYNEKKDQMKINGNNLEKKEDKICVYITGEVKNPGVYYLKENSRLYDLIDICGGLTDVADIASLNLAKKLVDSDKIIIPVKKENNEEVESIQDNDYEEDIESQNNKVNINTASKEELQTLDGIGEKTAEKIIEYRKHQRFNDIEELMEVPGIGNSKFESIKDYICVD